jgi:hypothetical protein
VKNIPYLVRSCTVPRSAVDYLTRGGAEGTGTHNPPGNGRPSPSPEAPRDNDFDDGADALWSLYEKETKSRDETRIQTLKDDDMDGALMFVCAYFLQFARPL